ncbi:TolC family outer membrane protein [Alteriqipengyuania sp. WL0013]|uniref:TolC family outer membrane protein n=1 Tax=Alteriqipengyuania sp. WL0013 TaxID=3110773 RepID=UPI002D0E45F6|nr:TolC family outer membrane protein [Alteriqipengyuania sp. WL0013]MEB3416352.1 TolC family outer membrane protein [Alteriqipengyuania sp. WL0013]
MAKGGFALLCGAALAAVLAVPASADTLKEALAEAYRNNPTLESARAQQRALDENVPIERADGLPSVSGNASYFEFLEGQGNAARSAGAGIDLGVPLYTGGAVRRSVQAAETRVEAGRADLRGTESFLFTQVVGAYMDVIQNEAIVGLSQANVNVLQVNFEATGDRFEIGDLTLTDVAQSESRLALSRSDLRSAQSNLINARERYIQLVGSEPDDLQPPPPLPGLPASPEEAVAIALDNNPDLIAAVERARAAGLDVDIARAGRLPRVEGFVNAGYDNTLGSVDTDGLPVGVVVTDGSTAVTAGVRASIPIFTGGRTGAFIRQSQARREAALEQVIAVERDIIAQVRGAYASWEAANAIIASTQVAVDAAELSLEGVRAENSVGNRTVLDVLNAEQELLRSRVQLVTARRNAYVAGFSLLAAMGRAEARDLGLEEYGPLYDPALNLERVRGQVWDWSNEPDPVASATRTVDTEAQDGEISDQP